MDLHATGQMKDRNLDKTLEEYGIMIPSLRGIRIMAEEEQISDKDIEKSCRYAYIKTRKLYTPDKYWHPNTDKRQSRALARRSSKNAYNQFRTFNSHVGQKDVWMVHARLSDRYWKTFDGRQLMNQSWFIEKATDGMDATYCDIYIRLS